MKNLTNILQSQGMQTKHASGAVQANEARALENVGNLANSNPDLAKLMNDPNMDFKALLEGMSHEEAQALVDAVNNGVDVLAENQGQLQAQLQQGLTQQPLVQNAMMTGQDASQVNTDFNQPTEPKTLEALLGQNTKMASNGETVVDTSKMKQAEDATRAFIPERKSIFQVNKQAPQTNTQANTQTVQDSNEVLNLNQFMSKQSASAKNRMVAQNYQNEQKSMFAPKVDVAKLDGMKNQNTQQVSQMTSTQSEQAMPQFDMSGGDAQMNQEFMGQHTNHAKAPLAMGATTKVFDMSTLQNTENTQDVINQIQNYIIQSKASNEQSVQMTFNHHELGNVDLQVMKGAGDHLNIMINAQSAEGAKFFQQNQGELLQSLQQAGVQVAEFKLDSSSQSNNNSQNSDSNKQFSGQEKQHAEHEQNKRDNESEKRKELWAHLTEEREIA